MQVKNLHGCLNIADLQKRARRRLPRPVFAYLEGGAEDEATMRRNRSSFADFALLPRAMQDVSRVDTCATAMTQCLGFPFVVAPTGMPALFNPAGELAIVRAAADVGALYTLSTMASCSIEEVAAATTAPKAFQLYIMRDRAITRDLIQRAKAAGYSALMLTVDIQVPANRERDKRSGMVIPPRFGVRSLVDFALRPGWCWHALRQPVTLANFRDHRAAPGSTLLNYISEQFEPATTWKDLDWVAAQWGGPLAIKGVMRPDDAVRAWECGATSVILSNHGGRQLDAAAAPLDMLERTVTKLDGRAEVILDGGIRRGTDMLKALALGATACMAGRIGLYGLAAGGEAGVRRAFGLLREEFARDMALLGVRSCAEIDRRCVIARLIARDLYD